MSITIDENRSDENNYKCMKAIMQCVRYSSQILNKHEFINKNY